MVGRCVVPCTVFKVGVWLFLSFSPPYVIVCRIMFSPGTWQKKWERHTAREYFTFCKKGLSNIKERAKCWQCC